MKNRSSNFRMAVIGDVHLHFDAHDVAYFNQSDYDLILFVGDLVNYAPWRGKKVWQHMNNLRRPVLFMPGNHDSTHVFQLIAEVVGNSALSRATGFGQLRAFNQLRRELPGIAFCGYSLHPVASQGFRFDIVAGRPHSMGGPTLSFAPFLGRKYGIHSMADSARLICEQIDQSQTENILILGHNGPTGLGSRRDDIWGCDFKKEQGDFGDPDLELAVTYAREQGKNVLAVVGGHMHHGLKGGGTRRWEISIDDVPYVNCARVPRIFQRDGKTMRHHVRLEMSSEGVEISAQEI